MNMIGKQVRKYRKSLDLTQGDLAEGICNRSYISQLEKGYSLPAPELLAKIAERLKVSMDDLCADLDTSSMEKVQVQNRIRFIISSIEENNWEKAHKWLCSLSDTTLTPAEKSVYEWGKGVLTQLDECFYQAVGYYLESISLAREVDRDPLLLIRPLIALGELYSMTEQAHKAIHLLHEAMQIALQYDISGPIRIALHYTLGHVHMKIGEYQSGIEYYQQAEKLNQAYGTLYKSGQIYMGLAVCYLRLKQYEEAEQTNFKALDVLRLYTDSKKETRIAGVHNNLGMVYRLTQRYDLAIVHLEKAISIHRETGSQHWLNNAMIELANVYNQMERYEEAKQLCQTVIERHTTEHTLAEANITLAEALCHIGEKEQALTAIDQALDYFRELPNNKYYVRAFSILAHLSFSDHENKDISDIYQKHFVLTM